MKLPASPRVSGTLKNAALILLVAAVFVLSCLLYLYFRKTPASAPGKTFSNQDFRLDTWISPYDADGDGIDDQTDILQNARDYLAADPKYESRYYQTGYPDDGYGVCTDVVAFALRGAGYDLQALVDADIRTNHDGYADEKPDPKIDFRRVRNLLVYFQHMSGSSDASGENSAAASAGGGTDGSAASGGDPDPVRAGGTLACTSLSCDPLDIRAWQGGDIVIFSNHIAIVSDRRNKDGVCLILHHANPFQLSFEEDGLSWYGQIRGHFRLIPPEMR